MAREELKWQNIDADDLPAQVKKSFDAMVEAEAAFKADLEKLLKAEGHMPEDKFLVMSRKGKRLGVAYASAPRGEGDVLRGSHGALGDAVEAGDAGLRQAIRTYDPDAGHKLSTWATWYVRREITRRIKE